MRMVKKYPAYNVLLNYHDTVVARVATMRDSELISAIRATKRFKNGPLCKGRVMYDTAATERNRRVHCHQVAMAQLRSV